MAEKGYANQHGMPDGGQAPPAQPYYQGQPGVQPGAQPGYYAQQPGQQPMYQPQPGQQPGQQPMYQPQPGQQPGQQPMYQPQPGYPAGQMAMQPAPGGIAWMQKPVGVVGCPPGLEYLSQVDQLLVKQQIEMMEVFTNIEMNNKYIIRNSMGQQVYFAHEETDFCMRNCCGPRRAFTIHVEDNMGARVIDVLRPYKCQCVGQCFSCSSVCQDEVEVQAPPGTTVGYVKQLYEGCEITYAIMDERRSTVLKIKGPNYCHCHCPGDDVPFNLVSSDGAHTLGKITKQWGNLMREMFTDADNFGIQFPMDLSVTTKAVMVGAVFLIDFMFFEQAGNRNQVRH